MGGSQRDAGLVRAVGPWSLAANILSMIIGAGIFAVPGALAACMGPYAPLAFLACGVAIGAVALCWAEGGSRMPTSGGAYGYIEAAFGPLTGYIAGTLLWFGDVLACGGVAAALADAVVSVLPPSLRAAIHAAAIVAVIGGIVAVNISGGLRRGARLVNLTTVLKLAPLAVFVLAGVWAIHGANFAPPAKVSTQGMGRALILALFALSGMEASLSISGEVRQPASTIPRALAIALGSALALYVAIQVTAQGILGSSLAHSGAPLVDAMARLSPALRMLMLIGTAVAMLGWLSSDLLSSPRVVFAFARDGLLPRVLGRLHPRTNVPHIAILCYAALAAALALTGTFAELAVLAMLATAPLYIAGCAAAWRLKRRGVAMAGAPLNVRWMGAAALVGIGCMMALIAAASRAEILGLLAVIGASAAIYVAQTRLRRGARPSKVAARPGL
ncbi:MAG: amino acid permease [Acidobacteriaceae bacterium]